MHLGVCVCECVYNYKAQASYLSSMKFIFIILPLIISLCAQLVLPQGFRLNYTNGLNDCFLLLWLHMGSNIV